MTAQAPERKYALTKMDAGDYMLPGNDGRTLWRIQRHKLGHLADVDEFSYSWSWELRRFDRPLPLSEYDLIDAEREERWEFVEGPFKTRKEAIEEAMRLS